MSTTPLQPLTDPKDRERIDLLFRTKGDLVSFCGLRHEDPTELFLWATQPHIQAWHTAISAAYKAHQEADTAQALSRALRDITRILDLEADSTLRIRAVNAIIRLANAIKRGSSLPATGRAGVGLAKSHTAETMRPDLPLPEDGCQAAGSQTKSASKNSDQSHPSHRSHTSHSPQRATKEPHTPDVGSTEIPSAPVALPSIENPKSKIENRKSPHGFPICPRALPISLSHSIAGPGSALFS